MKQRTGPVRDIEGRSPEIASTVAERDVGLEHSYYYPSDRLTSFAACRVGRHIQTLRSPLFAHAA